MASWPNTTYHRPGINSRLRPWLPVHGAQQYSWQDCPWQERLCEHKRVSEPVIFCSRSQHHHLSLKQSSLQALNTSPIPQTTMFSAFNLVVLVLAAVTQAFPKNPPKFQPKMPCRGNPTSHVETEKIGDGNPHQNFVFKQISGVTDCTNNPSGSVAIANGLIVSWSASVGFTSSFITGGFDVSESVSTSSTNTFGCATSAGSHTGDLCVFERIQVTAFTARSRTCSTTCAGTSCTDYGSPGVIFAPNSQQGSCFYDNYQVNLPCGLQGSEHLIQSGPSGGPQFIGCEPTMA